MSNYQRNEPFSVASCANDKSGTRTILPDEPDGVSNSITITEPKTQLGLEPRIAGSVERSHIH